MMILWWLCPTALALSLSIYWAVSSTTSSLAHHKDQMLFGIHARWPPVKAAFCCRCPWEVTSAGRSMQCLGGRWVEGVEMWAGRQVGVGPGGQVIGLDNELTGCGLQDVGASTVLRKHQ